MVTDILVILGWLLGIAGLVGGTIFAIIFTIAIINYVAHPEN